ncbi:hypothetical protein [Secundilactobacillus oryzae]|uniref:hypothetical protein n=1 Tax=Secundilactobacillus oryzae TaxID=1202668 RepID=UPI000A7E50D2|nr:hypothetical protein [Secundilactobacillus oryzae]
MIELVKQGQFAGSSSQKKIKNKLRHKQKKTGQSIESTDLEAFVVGRYRLTQSKQLSQVKQEALQRYLMVWLETAQAISAQPWLIQQITKSTFQRINIRLPWQFYMVISDNWMALQRFIVREIPAVPLSDRLIVTDEVNSDQIDTMVAEQLAVNFFIDTFKTDTKRLAGVTTEQIRQLQTSFLTEDQLDWTKVRGLFTPIGYVREKQDDELTKKWLATLAKI